ncbi:hypothetical protein Gohar_022007 [Gossypium harknessii]|uniref:4-hydroxy-4-methyl-2-oxoglutarate aldolase n=1 Tax=Gossypium harknessii TaxID=34285 RepID=A0A7J9IAP3_9ROSI|nr:hypothetical protein [Gossypium harknessii]
MLGHFETGFNCQIDKFETDLLDLTFAAQNLMIFDEFFLLLYYAMQKFRDQMLETRHLHYCLLQQEIFITVELDFPAGRHRAAIATADVCDSNAALLVNGDLRALDPIFKIYGRRLAFSGPIVTVKVFEDNVLVRQLLETEGNGRVLVIDGGGSTRCALVGGNLAQWAHDMAWAGIIVNGCIRDVDEINACDIGVRALGSNPLKSNKKAVGDKHVPVRIAGTLIHDGEWLYADSDGILISKTELSV